jgi:hypothetical protein
VYTSDRVTSAKRQKSETYDRRPGLTLNILTYCPSLVFARLQCDSRPARSVYSSYEREYCKPRPRTRVLANLNVLAFSATANNFQFHSYHGRSTEFSYCCKHAVLFIYDNRVYTECAYPSSAFVKYLTSDPVAALSRPRLEGIVSGERASDY